MKDKIIERVEQRLNFTEQLQNQIQICREALSNPEDPLSSKVEALEVLLWAKLRNDKGYQEKRGKINKWFKDVTKNLEQSRYMTEDMRDYFSYIRIKAKKKFKEIMIFIDKKDLMPIGEI